ncbi:putative 4-coumarate--CoA ligase 3, partial [Frankliniella fusca]
VTSLRSFQSTGSIGVYSTGRAPSLASATTPQQADRSHGRVLESAYGKDLPPQSDTLIDHLWKDLCVWEDKKFIPMLIAIKRILHETGNADSFVTGLNWPVLGSPASTRPYLGIHNISNSPAARRIGITFTPVTDMVSRSVVRKDHYELAFLTCAASSSSYTYREARRLSHGFARALAGDLGGLAKRGPALAKGDVVAIIAPNIPEFVFATHGAIEAGLTVTFVNPLYTPEETGRQLKICNARLVATIPALLPLVRAVAQALPQYKGTVLLDRQPSEQDAAAGEFSLQALAAEGLATEGVSLPRSRSEDIAILPFSSGTTGMPKGVMLSHGQLVSNLAMCMHPDFRFARYTRGDVQDAVLSVLPFFHIYGFNTVLHTSILSGQHLIALPKFTPEDYIGALLRHRPTGLMAVPAVIQFLAMHPAVKPEHLESIRYVICGAAPLGLDVLKRLNDKAGREIDLRQGYGMTETSPATILCSRLTPQEKRGSVGQLLPGTRARVVDLGSGVDVGPGQHGELLVKGPQVMTGYFNNEEATREVLDAEGWLHTGDVAYYDDECYFHIVDRTKELIKVKGHQVSPTELESVIRQIVGIADVAVVGAPNERYGEVPVAFIVLQPGAKLQESDITSFVEPKVAPHKKLAGGVKFIEAIPRNAGGKVLRNELKKLVAK